MRKPLVMVISAFAALAAGHFLIAPCFAGGNGDFQFWSTAGASVDLSKNWGATFEEEFRFGDNAGHLYYHHSDLGFVYRGLANWASFGFGYRQVFEEDSSSEWRYENQPYLNATLSGNFFGLDVSDRSRLEYRDREVQEDTWRYRNKVTVKVPVALTPLKLQPYFAEEVFLNLEGEAFSKNRIYSGFSINLTEKIKGEIYYLLQSTKSGDNWKDINVLGIALKVAF